MWESPGTKPEQSREAYLSFLIRFANCSADWNDDDREIDPNMLNFVFSSYLACAAHNGQLVLKDGLKLNEEYTKLIKKVSHDIVSKTKVSNLIAEEIRNLDKVLKT